jgi:uridine kinase
MIGDRLIIKDFHTRAAQQICDALTSEIRKKKGHYTITIAGESGSGKSEVAAELARLLAAQSISSYIFQQDDYFVYPPKTNERMRREDINHVGTGEVRLDLLNNHLQKLLKGEPGLKKPLVIFDEDRIDEEEVALKNVKTLIIEGTYTSLLESIDCRIFIDRDYRETKKSRLERAREAQDDFLERVLQIEHEIISQHKARAHIIITGDFDAVPHKPQ